ncbi:MAG: hemolysin activation/secretion protein [Granulosicoccus sp.]|jgi:hemolysin activation/secretion protein
MGFLKKTVAAIFIVISSESLAQNNIRPSAENLPSPADIGRYVQEQKRPAQNFETYSLSQSLINKKIEIPDDTKNVKFVLNKLIIEGVEKFTFEELEPIYKGLLGQEVSLYDIWQIAEKITKYYQDRGYFISRASVVGSQMSSRGIFKIKIIEGYVGQLFLDDKAEKIPTIANLVKKLKLEKPLNIKNLEKTLLIINDLPSYSFQSIIEPIKNNGTGAIKLSIISKKKEGSGKISFNNHNPKFIGTHQLSASYSKSFTDLSKTSVSYTTSAPVGELQFFNIAHDITILPTLTVGFYGGKADMELGSSLKEFGITSEATSFGLNVTKKIIRQRQENFSIKFNLDNTNISSDINLFSKPLAREKNREAKLSFLYDRSDPLGGYNYLDTTITRGLNFFGASERGDEFLSRQKVNPDYNKIEFRLNRFQNFGRSWSTTLSSEMQFASGRLYSSGRMAYGGQSFGRAFDNSEVTGDNGIIMGTEIRYLSIPKISLPILKRTSLIPYAYYDIGRLWDVGENAQILSSIGEGFRVESNFGLGANFLIANPISDRGSFVNYFEHKDPRYLIEVFYKF